MSRSLRETLSHLPPPAESPLASIRTALRRRPQHKVVVLDDDPTGTQTVHDIAVLTTWDTAALAAEFADGSPGFYILTNSRSLAPSAAYELNFEIARTLRRAAGGRTFTVISRSDSTLRGHFPIETDALAEVLGPFDATVIMPYFEAGGRYTIDDVHYVAQGDELVPAAATPFARDATFGYSRSNLREWIEEKTAGRVRGADVHSVSIAELRQRDPCAAQRLCDRLRAFPRGGHCIVNACHPSDAARFAAGALLAEEAGMSLLYRTAAQFVSARLGIEPRPLLTSRDFNGNANATRGGLVVVGSHVPQSTAQLTHLLETRDIARVELAVPRVLDAARRGSKLARDAGGALRPDHPRDKPASATSRENARSCNPVVREAAATIDAHLRAGRDAVLFTSRELVVGLDAADSLQISAHVSRAVVDTVAALQATPRFLVAKGGITSSDVATKAVGVRRAIVRGQILPGIPVWRLGDESRFPGLDYIVFPGNVGGPDALAEVCRKLSSG
jgi:uncharacterized protein YgbK (DUF1537 family)